MGWRKARWCNPRRHRADRRQAAVLARDTEPGDETETTLDTADPRSAGLGSDSRTLVRQYLAPLPGEVRGTRLIREFTAHRKLVARRQAVSIVGRRHRAGAREQPGYIVAALRTRAGRIGSAPRQGRRNVARPHSECQ